MSTTTITTDQLTKHRITALQAIANGDNLVSTEDVGPEIQALFKLESGSGYDFAMQLLEVLKLTNVTDEEHEATLWALGIAYNANQPEIRQDELMNSRFGQGKWDVTDKVILPEQQSAGITAIAHIYDFAIEVIKEDKEHIKVLEAYRELATIATTAANSQSVPANLRRSLNLAIQKVNELDATQVEVTQRPL